MPNNSSTPAADNKAPKETLATPANDEVKETRAKSELTEKELKALAKAERARQFKEKFAKEGGPPPAKFQKKKLTKQERRELQAANEQAKSAASNNKSQQQDNASNSANQQQQQDPLPKSSAAAAAAATAVAGQPTNRMPGNTTASVSATSINKRGPAIIPTQPDKRLSIFKHLNEPRFPVSSLFENTTHPDGSNAPITASTDVATSNSNALLIDTSGKALKPTHPSDGVLASAQAVAQGLQPGSNLLSSIDRSMQQLELSTSTSGRHHHLNVEDSQTAPSSGASTPGKPTTTATTAAADPALMTAFIDPTTSAPNEIPVHPSVITTGLKIAAGNIVSSDARTIAMLQSLIDAITDYHVPPQQIINRHLIKYIQVQTKYLEQQRPLTVGMNNAMRWLSEKVSKIEVTLDEKEAKLEMVQNIRDYIKERITAPRDLIVEYGLKKIQDGDVILTYGGSSTVKHLLIAAHKSKANLGGKRVRFRVIVVDSRPHWEGREFVRSLIEAGFTKQTTKEAGLDVDTNDDEDIDFVEPPISTTFNNNSNKSEDQDSSSSSSSVGSSGGCTGITYISINALGYVMRDVSKVLLGAEAFFANGTLLGKAGTALVALSAQTYRVPVIAVCPTHKFTSTIRLDSVVDNELGNPDQLVWTPGYSDNIPSEQTGTTRQLNPTSSLSSSGGIVEGVNFEGNKKWAYHSMDYSPFASDRYSSQPHTNNSSGAISLDNNSNTTNENISKKSVNSKSAPSVSLKNSSRNNHPLAKWREAGPLKLLNLVQDLTPAKLISVIITDVGLIPTTSIPVVVREYSI
ncbi:hypothetical protein H4219_003244 [Mycoemilia scoparia]|uniref:Translation initiation factor eIF2B subunit delta n=1 Tax=Mycoemilia scoparia TaxID=417184 RepID=A0A9W7ZZA4_9FUNG|nr:hypothetical protein H4219_003244 [Mycoemilia scoparia]